MLVSPSSRHFYRPAAALSVLGKLLPAVTRLWERIALRGERLPFEDGRLSVLDHGSGDTVYLLENAHGVVVCKVQRVSLGRTLPELIALAAHRREVYEDVLRHYDAVRGVFPATRFLIVHGPLFGAPVVLSVQTYVGGPARDLLADFDDQELEALFAAHPHLRSEVAAFIECTLEAWRTDGWFVDLGRRNLLLVKQRDGYRLAYVDVEMKRLSTAPHPRRASIYRPQIERMRRILRLARSGDQLVGRTDSRVGTIRSTRNEGRR